MGSSSPTSARGAARARGRYDGSVADPGPRTVRIRLAVAGGDAWDAVLDGGARLEPADGAEPDAALSADAATWRAIAEDVRSAESVSRRPRRAAGTT